jgi:lathosterol oxidase
MPVYVYIIGTLIAGNFAFWCIGGAVHYWFYIKNRDKSEQWKHQSNKFLSDKLNREQRLLGVLNYNLAVLLSSILIWGVVEKGWSQLYWDISQYSLVYTFLSIFLCWLLIEISAYYIHTASHFDWFYKRFHRVHHKYTTPSFYSLSAMHPAEWLLHVGYILMPMFILPMHVAAYLFVVIACFVAGFWDHCGIRLPSIPLHGNGHFHDDHHKYFHVNFGFTCDLFDRIHDTIRREGHHYTEETFAGGKGRVIDPEVQVRNAIGKRFEY